MQWRWRRAHLGHQHLRQHLLLVLLAEIVGDDPRHALLEAHLLDLLVLDVAAQREAKHEFVVVERPLLVLRRLRRNEGALDVALREVRTDLGQRGARHRGCRAELELLAQAAPAQLGRQHLE